MATYNGSEYLRQQLDSLLNQTVSFEELIICDDCSNDKTIEILNEYASKDARIKIIVNEYNLGFNYNFQKALSLCSGDYIAICDQDDIWLPRHLEVLSKLLDTGASLSVGGTKFIDKTGKYLTDKSMAQTRNFPCLKVRDNSDIFSFVCFYMNPFQGASMMVRKDFLSFLLPLPPSAYIYDVWFTLCASLCNRLAFNPEVISLWRRHQKNATNNFFNHPYIRTWVGHIFKIGPVNHRRDLLTELNLRFKGKINFTSQLLLDELIEWDTRRNSIIGRFINAYKELIFWRRIQS